MLGTQPMEPMVHPVKDRGKVATALSPRRTYESPRYSASVPMVTASAGSPSTATKNPLTAPRMAPRTTASTRIVSSGSPASHITPIALEVKPTIEATDRSISPVTMMSVIGRASSRIGARSSTRKPKLRAVPKCSTPSEAAMRNAIVTPMIAASQPNVRRVRTTGAVGVVSAVRSWVSADMVGLSRGCCRTDGDHPVQGDRADDQSADDGALPELIDAQRRQGVVDNGQQQRAQRGAEDRAASAEYRHSADDDGGHDVQFHAVTRRGIHRAVPRGVKHTADAGENAGDDVGGHQPAGCGNAGECGRLGAGAEGVQVPAGAVLGEVDPHDDGHCDGDEREVGQAEDPAGAEIQERPRHIPGADA